LNNWIVWSDDGSQVIASAGAGCADIESNRHMMFGGIEVLPAFRGRGIARALLDAAEAAMRAEGYERAQLWTLEGSPAERLYTALGWRRDGRRDIYPPMGLPIVAYVRKLAAGR
jgi:GNAT superfamily N-acetyltransferase